MNSFSAKIMKKNSTKILIQDHIHIHHPLIEEEKVMIR